jgi:arylsulfatase A-like enzyme
LETFDHPVPQPISEDRVPGHQNFHPSTDGLDYVDRYDEEIAYVDGEIGRLLERFDRLYSLDDAFVFFTADHGESMMEHENWFTHGYHVYEEIVRVPLMVRGPGVRPGSRDALASGIDLAPAILRLAGARRPMSVSGVDLLDPEALATERTIFAEATRADYQWRLALRGDGRWMGRLENREAKVVAKRFYDLGEDRAQVLPRSWHSESGPAEELLRSIAADPDPAGWPLEMREGIRLNAPKVAPRADEEALNRLRALGYVH